MKSSVVDNCLPTLLELLAGFSPSQKAVFTIKLNEALWLDIANQAIKLGVGPLLYYRFRNSASCVPSDVLNKLKKSYHTIAFRNKMIYTMLSESLLAFQAADIPVIVLKGIHLAEIVYGNIALRPMQDADILVKRQDIPRVEKILLRLGFDPPEHPRIRNHRDSRVVFHKIGGASIEVHWILDRPGSAFTIDHNGLWHRAYPITISGAQTLALSPEDLLLHVCWQMSVNKKFKKGLYPFFDVQAIINRFRDTFDWDEFALRSKQWNFNNCVYVCLFLAEEFLKIDIPPEVFDRLRSPDITMEIIDYAREQALSPLMLSENFLQLGSLDSSWKKIRLIKKVFFPRLNTIEKKYCLSSEKSVIYLYYPVYWIYLLGKYSALALEMLQGNRFMKKKVEAQRRQDILQAWMQKVSPTQRKGRKSM